MKHNRTTIPPKNKKLLRSVTVSMSVGFFEPMVEDWQRQGYDVVSVSSDGPELERLRAKGVKTVVVEMERRMAPLKDLKSLFQLIRVFRKEKPDIVHSMTPKAGMLCMLAAWLTRVPRRLHTFTGLVWPTTTGLTRRILMFTDWLTCACATHVIPEGQGVMNDLQQHITHKPMKVLGYGNVRGVDMARFSRRPEVMRLAESLRKSYGEAFHHPVAVEETSQSSIGAFTFLFVGRLVSDKGINELVQAFSRLHNEVPETRLVLVGAYEPHLDPLLPETERIIAEAKGIEVVGEKSGDELLAWYAASDVFVFPSYREGFPNVVLEAGAMGLPCIVTDINGSREIIEEGRNGVIVPSQDAEALYTVLRHWTLHPEVAETLAKEARPIIASRFERSFVQRCLYEFYAEL